MKKILVINGSASPLKCGVGYYGEKLVHELAKSNEIHVLTSIGLGEDIKDTKHIYHTNSWKIKQLPKLASIVSQIKPDIIHIQYPAVGYKRELGINLLTLWLKIFNPKIPVVVTLHEYHESAGLGKTRNLITVLFAKKIIVSNRLDIDSLPKFLRKKTALIPIGSNIPVYEKNQETFRSILLNAKMLPNKPTIAYFGFINPNKGIETLINAAKNIDAQVLLLAELKKDNPYHTEIESMVTSAKNQGAKIHITGFLENKKLSQILQECTFFVLPQQLPLTAKSGTAIAASIHGVPVVSKKSANPDYNHPYIADINSILLNYIDEKSLAEACNNLISDLDKVQSIKSECLKLKSYFSWKSIAEKHRDLYDSIS